jgi:uncharacterized FAD-dependent dehydrogenase
MCPATPGGYGGAAVFSDKLYFDAAGGWLEEKTPGIEPKVYMSLVSEIYEKHVGQLGWQPTGRQSVDLNAPGLKLKPYPNLVPTTLKTYMSLVDKMIRTIEQGGCEVHFSTNVNSVSKVEKPNPHFRLTLGNGRQVEADVVLIATGRVGTSWLYGQAARLGLRLDEPKPLFGVRVETLSSRVRDLTALGLDPKIKSTIDQTKLHCVCGGGQVMSISCENMTLVDGTKIQSPTPNTSFNILTPILGKKHPAKYGRAIVAEMIRLGRGVPLVQRMEDFMHGVPSDAKSINSGSVTPTLTKCTAGEITRPLPDDLQERIINFLWILGERFPGVLKPDNLVYAPVFEWFYPAVKRDETGNTSVRGLFVAGDAAGDSQGVVMAGASGVRAAFAIESYLDSLNVN